MMSGRDRTTDSLLRPGRGHNPSYGLNDEDSIENKDPESSDGVSVSILHAKERLWTVALFSIIACIGSVVIGMSLGYSTNTLSELSDLYHRGDHVYGIENGTWTASLFGVSSYTV